MRDSAHDRTTGRARDHHRGLGRDRARDRGGNARTRRNRLDRLAQRGEARGRDRAARRPCTGRGSRRRRPRSPRLGVRLPVRRPGAVRRARHVGRVLAPRPLLRHPAGGVPPRDGDQLPRHRLRDAARRTFDEGATPGARVRGVISRGDRRGLRVHRVLTDEVRREGLRRVAARRGASVRRARLDPEPPDTDTPGFRTENEIKPEECARISATIKPITAEKVARAVVRGIERDKLHTTAGRGRPGWSSSGPRRRGLARRISAV